MDAAASESSSSVLTSCALAAAITSPGCRSAAAAALERSIHSTRTPTNLPRAFEARRAELAGAPW